MKDNSKAFAKGAVQIKRRMWCKNLKLQLLIIGIVLVILIIIIVPIALKFTKCKNIYFLFFFIHY